MYRRQFSVPEITEAFAATRGLAMPSQLRHMLRERGRDLHAEFLDLLPVRPRPISIQRFSLRRFGLALLVLTPIVPMVAAFATQTDQDSALLHTADLDCTDQEALWLMAQAVPSASLVPCTGFIPDNWTLSHVRVARGYATMVFDTHFPNQAAAVTVQLARSCDLTGSTEVSSEQPGATRHIRIDRDVTPVQVVRTYVFEGGCVSERYVAPVTSPERLAENASSAFGFVTRKELAEDLNRRSAGRLRLDPP